VVTLSEEEHITSVLQRTDGTTAVTNDKKHKWHKCAAKFVPFVLLRDLEIF
jgi:hypothetical protein